MKNLGLSTYSKLLYFLGISLVEGGPALILEERVSRVFKCQKFEEFNNLDRIYTENSYRYYLNYIQRLYDLTKQMEVRQD
ncbi:8-oxoguanine DNA glycosylase OGG fold protein [Sphingobacterium sp. ML3W]|uniref:8-oxoguanine DNA glycosylase OGG fold protein n=1 Tax=Sphingobacterium sp. ML3W TaxID=1538644 RepID=UPI003FA781F1